MTKHEEVRQQMKELSKETRELLRLMEKVNRQSERYFDNSYKLFELQKEIIIQQES